jgi:hypothetical protein
MDTEFDPLALNTEIWNFEKGFRVSHILDAGDRPAFYEFSSARISTRTLGLSTVVCIFINIYYFTFAFVNASPEHIISFIPALLTIFLRLPSIMISLYIRGIKERKEFVSPTLQNIYEICDTINVLGGSSTDALFLFARLYNGECNSLNQLVMWSCNSGFASRSLPVESVVMLLIQPILNSISFKSLRFEYVLASWVFIMSVLFTAVGVTGATQTLPALLMYVPLSLIGMFETHRQDLILYFIVKSQRKLLAENKQMSEERTTEMRHMIANVAHDLKTVSFVVLFHFFVALSFCLFLSAIVRLHEWRRNRQKRAGIHQRTARHFLQGAENKRHV